MRIIPAIDLLGGRCVRLTQGDYHASTVYHEDPVEQARAFADAGATRIHVVDLDAARGGSNNRAVIAAIRRAVSCAIEVGGGVRSEAAITTLFDLGIDFAVVGTALARDTRSVCAWAERFPRRVIAGIDARDGVVRVDGWRHSAALPVGDLVHAIDGAPFESLAYTNIAHDGMLGGPDITGALRVASISTHRLIVSGGVSCTEDVAAVCRAAGAAIAALIVGRALYEGTFDLTVAIEHAAACSGAQR